MQAARSCCARRTFRLLAHRYQLPADKVEALFNGESPDLNDEAAEIYGQKRVAVALARTSSDGDRQGIVLVSVERETISELRPVR